MSLDGQVLMIALFVVALKLILWSKQHVVVVAVKPDPKELFHLDHSRLRLPAEARPDEAEGIFAKSLSRRLEGDRYV